MLEFRKTTADLKGNSRAAGAQRPRPCFPPLTPVTALRRTVALVATATLCRKQPRGESEFVIPGRPHASHEGFQHAEREAYDVALLPLTLRERRHRRISRAVPRERDVWLTRDVIIVLVTVANWPT